MRLNAVLSSPAAPQSAALKIRFAAADEKMSLATRLAEVTSCPVQAGAARSLFYKILKHLDDGQKQYRDQRDALLSKLHSPKSGWLTRLNTRLKLMGMVPPSAFIDLKQLDPVAKIDTVYDLAPFRNSQFLKSLYLLQEAKVVEVSHGTILFRWGSTTVADGLMLTPLGRRYHTEVSHP